MKLRNASLVALLAAATSACDVFEDANPLTEFAYNEGNHGTVIEDFAATTEIGGEFYLEGELNTPTSCYELTAKAETSGRRITMTVTGTRRSITCAQQVVGTYRYQAVFRAIDRGTYDLKVLHSFAAAERPTKEFNFVVNVR